MPHRVLPAEPYEGGLIPYIRYRHLVANGIVSSWQQLVRMIDHEGFPAGILLSRNIRAWRHDEVQAWLDSRPTARKIPPPRKRQPRRSK